MHTSQRPALKLVAVATILLLAATACSKKTVGGGPAAKAGGTFRAAFDEFPWSASGNGFDPSFEYLTTDWMIFSDTMLRTLMSYNHRSSANGGTKVLPDLATGPGDYSADHKSVTYHLKSGIKFAPPVNRVITSKDIAYAMQRVATKALDSGGYANYYTETVKGLQEFSDKKASTVSGVTTPDDNTIKIEFTKPVYDFDYRAAMPALAPIPKEVAGCFNKPLDYGQYVVSSGPYMFEGYDKVDISSCKKITKPSGFSFDKQMTLVRNPNYVASTDSKEIREALPDKFEFTLNTNADDIFSRTELNKIDWAAVAVPGKILQKYTSNAALKPYLHSHNVDLALWYLTMNLTVPPFDDLHVRKAANFIMDKAGLLQVIGGPLKGQVAEHIVPPGLLGGNLAPGQFDPYASAGHAGDLVKAKAEMKLSKYDKNQDGLCDSNLPACNNVSNVTRQTAPFPDMEPIIDASFKKIGVILAKAKEVKGYYGEAGAPAKKNALGMGGGWGPDWPEALTFYQVPFTGAAIGPAGNINTSLIGLTKENAKTLGVDYPADGVPSVDGDIAACAAKAGTERLNCWIALDKHLMNDIVPMIPLRWSEANFVVSAAVTGWDFDQFSSEPSFAHIGIDPSKQVQ